MSLADHHAAIQSLYGRSLLLTQQASLAQITGLLALADHLRRRDEAGLHTALLPHQLALAVFFDQSTRTQSAWAGAAARLGMQPVVISGSSTQVGHGESATETGAMLAMNAHAIGIRHDRVIGEGHRFMRQLLDGVNAQQVASTPVPVVNLQCDQDHPTQTLADLAFLRQLFPKGLREKRVTVSWACSTQYAKPLSVPQGLISLLSRFGVHLTLAHPPGYELPPQSLQEARHNAAASGGSFRVSHNMTEAFRSAQVVYPKSWGPPSLMRQQTPELERQALQQNRTHHDWICDAAQMSLTSDAHYMHCLPADIGVEVSDEVLKAHQPALRRQASHKLYIIMALLASAKVNDLTQTLLACEQTDANPRS